MAEVVDSKQDGRAEAARAAVSAARREDTELCARLVFRVSRNELRRVGITTPIALYDELKQVFWNADEGVTLGDHLSVGFGKVDRRRQVRAFAERHADGAQKRRRESLRARIRLQRRHRRDMARPVRRACGRECLGVAWCQAY